jgi:hypothetical protein
MTFGYYLITLHSEWAAAAAAAAAAAVAAAALWLSWRPFGTGRHKSESWR